MGKKKSDNDINAILSQLQKSYNINNTDDEEDDIFDSDNSYEDTDLNSLLAKILADNSIETQFERDDEPVKKETKPVIESINTIKSEDFVSVLESGEDISEGAKYTSPAPSPRVAVAKKDEPVSHDNPIEENVNHTSENVSAPENNIYAITEEIVAGDEDNDITFGELGEDDAEDDDMTFGELEEEDAEDDDMTFGELEEDAEDDGMTFGELEEDAEDDGMTFGELEEEDAEDDMTFGELKEKDTEDDVIFGELDDENADGDLNDNSSTLEESDVNFEKNEAVEAFDTNDYEDIQNVISEHDDKEAVTTEIVESITTETTSEVIEQTESSVVVQPIQNGSRADISAIRERLLKDDEDIADILSGEPHIEAIVDETANETSNILEEDVIVSYDEYTYDPLQWHFDRKKKVVVSDMPEDDVNSKKKSSDIHDDDISLLLQLGYKKELKNEYGDERTDSVVQSITNSYKPDKDKIPFGFCGKEFSETHQINKINQRYDADKRMLIIKTAVFSAIAIVLLILGILFKGRTDVGSLVMFPVMELLIIGLGCVIIHKELYRGLVGIFKFSPTIFTIPLFSLAVISAYDIFTIIFALCAPENTDISITPIFGFTSALFFVVALVSQLLNCIREHKTFALVSTSENLYAAENLISDDEDSLETDNLKTREIRKQIKGNAVIIKKTRYISEFFKRISESSYGIFNLAVILGAVALSSLIIAYIIIVTEHGAADVASTVIFTVYMCMSASFVLAFPLLLFSASETLIKKKCGFIGTSAIYEYSKTGSVIFEDTCAFDISNNVEVTPVGRGDMNSAIKTANRLFYSLGGTISEAIADNTYSADHSISPANINITVINDDGLELYMDGETHILFGNQKFMSMHRKQLNMDFENSYIAKTREAEVLYLAINYDVSLRYVLTVSLKEEFASVAQMLAENKMKALVYTYEPHIRPLNTRNAKVGVYKPYEHESPKKTSSRYGGIISSKEADIIHPLIMSNEVVQNVKISSRISLIFILVGIIASFAITLIGYLVPEAYGILKYRDLFTVLVQLAGLVPVAINSIRLFKKYR